MDFEMEIKQESPQDFDQVFHLIKDAFEKEVYTDHQEQFLVERLRKSKAFVPELSLVAEQNGKIVGYILLTKIELIPKDGAVIIPKNVDQFLALAPVAVHSEYQNQGIGAALIEEAHRKAKSLNFKAVILLGHADYYPRFGYQLCKDFGIELPFDVPEENCMALELFPGALAAFSRTVVQYPAEFFD